MSWSCNQNPSLGACTLQQELVVVVDVCVEDVVVEVVDVVVRVVLSVIEVVDCVVVAVVDVRVPVHEGGSQLVLVGFEVIVVTLVPPR
jgi:hypothetical protein